MGRILWSDRAFAALRRLAPSTRNEVEKRLDYIESMPRMYAVVDDERFPGCRSFSVEPSWSIFYMVAAGGRDCYIVDILEEIVEEA